MSMKYLILILTFLFVKINFGQDKKIFFESPKNIINPLKKLLLNFI